jgi:signal transduction histidine kinase
LLEWVKANRRRQNSTPEYINLSSLLNDNISFLNSRINEKNLTVDKKIGENIPIRCDKMMIDFVIKSILGNAIKFSHKESIIRIECSKVGNRAEMIISDSGIGIPKENLEKLFKLDEIISTAGTANEKGSGLGLIICRDFLELNNGKLSINSEFGKGTTVTVVLEGTDN